MESKTLEAIKNQLRTERSLLDGKANQLRAELTRLDSNSEKIDAAIAALDGQGLAPSPKAGKYRKRKGKQTPAPGKVDVIRALRQVLEKEGVVEEAVLKELVEEQITNAGFSRLGFALRFKEALAETEFVDSPGGVRLAELQSTGD